LFGLDGSELGDDDSYGFNDSFSFNIELLEGNSVLISLVSDGFLLFVEDIELDDLVLKLRFELSNLLGEGGDLRSRFLDLV